MTHRATYFTCILSILFFGCVLPGRAQSVNKNFEKGKEFYTKRNFEAATKSLKKAIEESPDCEDCYVYQVISFLSLSKYQDAYDYSNVGINKFSQQADLYHLRGHILYLTGDYFAALSDANMAVKYAKLDSTKISAYTLRTSTKLAMNNSAGAVEDCKEILKIDSTNYGALSNLSVAYSETGKLKEAIKIMRKVVSKDTIDAEGIGNLGYLLNLDGQYEEAIIWLTRAINSTKHKNIAPYALSNRGYSYLKLGEPRTGLKDVNASIEQFPSNSYAYRNLGLIYMELRDYDKACAAFKEAIAKGFTEMYGDEVKQLIKENCTNK